MLNWIWLGLVVIAVALGAITGQLPEVTAAAFDASKNAVMTLALPLAGLMALWLGLMRLAERSGLVDIVAVLLRPVLRRLFPEVPPDHPAMGAMVMNMAANMLGLGNAATPLGLRAMQHLERLNPHPGTATNSMCTFLAINTSSIQLIPATTVAILLAAGGTTATSIIGTTFVSTLGSTILAVLSVKLLEKLPVFAVPKTAVPEKSVERETAAEEAGEDRLAPPPAPLTTRGAILLIAALVFFALLMVLMAIFPDTFERMVNAARAFLRVGQGVFAFPPEWRGHVWPVRLVEALSILAIPFIFTMFPLYAVARGVRVYEELVEGAKEGFQMAVRIIPFLVAILSAVAMFRAAGGVDLLSRMLERWLQPVGFPPELLPLVFVRPLSGSGAMALFAELVKTHGPDSFIAHLGGTIMGSTETTFYVLAVYFGSVAIRRTRHAVAAGLIADLAGVVLATIVCHIVFR